MRFTWRAKTLQVLLQFCHGRAQRTHQHSTPCLCHAFSWFGISKHGLKEAAGWKEGVTKLVAILLVVIMTATSNFWPMSVRLRLSDISIYVAKIDVMRSGTWRQIETPRIVVGDIVFLKPGDEVPADGLFVDGCSLHVFESSKMEGQTKIIEVGSNENPFLSYGGLVVDGHARMLVTAVGKYKKNHKVLLNGRLVDESRQLASLVHKLGQAVAFLIFLVLLVRFFAGNIVDENGNRVSLNGKTEVAHILMHLVGILSTPAMIVLTSNLEELMLAVKLTLAYSIRRLMLAGILVRKPSVCQSIASVTTICMNNTGTLSLSRKEVAKFWLGLSSIEEVRHNLIEPNVLELLYQGIGLNTTQPPSRSLFTSPLNSTEKSIFDWGVQHLGLDIDTLRRSYTILEIEPFNSKRRQSGVLISKNAENAIYLHRKGAPEVIMPMCSHYYETTGNFKPINDNTRLLFEQILKSMAGDGLRCIALACRRTSIRDYFNFSSQQLILLGMVGLTKSRRGGVRKTLRDCLNAGVSIKLITGDNILTAKSMAIDCGIVDPIYQEGEVIVGEEFRNYPPQTRMEKADNIRVLASATPDDKSLLVQCLKQKGHVVAFLGLGIGDIQALKRVDVGLCFGFQGAGFAKACSPVVFRDKHFSLLMDIMTWGRGIYNSVQTYTQFLLTATFVALAVDFVRAVSPSEPAGFDSVKLVAVGKIPYPVFQLLWVKLIMGILAALALVIKQPSIDLMHHKQPRDVNEPILTGFMLWNICAHALYQTATLLAINFKGKALLNLNAKERDTLVLNTYILFQVFTIFRARLHEGIHQKKFFWGILMIIIAFQVLILEVLRSFAGTARLDLGQWGICISVAAASLPISWIIRSLSAIKGPFFSNFKLNLKTKVE